MTKPCDTARWLSLREAAAYCPYGEKKLIGMARSGKIRGGQMPDNKAGWFFDKLSIDEHMESMLPGRGAEEKAIAILRSLK